MDTIYTVSNINQYIKYIIENNASLQNILVQGEISGLRKDFKGHYYFSIKDEKCSLSCKMWSTTAARLDFAPKDGDEVLLKGTIDVYDVRGTYSLTAYYMEPYGLGKELLKLQELKKKLEKEGLFSLPKKEIPKFPRSIGIVSASTGAAVHDIINTIQKRYNPSIYVFPCLVQGQDAPKSIIKALENTKSFDLDLIIVGRGGGSNEDLFCFNDEELVRYVASMETPIISAVGHQIDSTLIDLVSDASCITPTDAGVKATPNKYDLIEELKSTQTNLNSLINRQIDLYKNRLLNINASKGLISPYDKYQIKLKEIKELNIRLNSRMNEIIVSLDHSISNLKGRLQALNPYLILNKGYSLVNLDEEIITSIDQVKENDNLLITFSDGKIETKVIKKIKENYDEQ